LLWLLLACLVPAPLVAQSDQVLPMAEKSLSFGLFADVNYAFNEVGSQGRGFANGALDLYMTAQISDRWSGLVELVFENDGNELITDLERLQVSWSYSDAFRIAGGRVHNPIIRWNIVQHHGAFMQTPIDKPAITRWEDQPGLWPVHFVGLLSSGQLRGPLGFHYDAGVGNGRGNIMDDVRVSGDSNTSTAVVGAFGFSPLAIDGLDVTVAGYADTISAANGDRLRERDLTISAFYLSAPLELRAEWASMRHSPIDEGGTFETRGWYVLAAMALPGKAHEIRPYVLLERLNPAEGEAFLEGAMQERAWVVGARFDLDSRVALKVDYRNQVVGQTHDHVVRAQLAVSLH